MVGVKVSTSTDFRKRAELYSKAAKLMEDGDSDARGSCCWAIGLTKTPGIDVFRSHLDADCQAMKRVFAPRGGVFWMEKIGDDYVEQHEGRILALCFMAAMVEAGDA